jgi:hypothetical protein
MLSDYTAFPECISNRKYVLKKLAGLLFIGLLGGLVVAVFIRMRVMGVGRELYKSGAPC